MVNLVNIFIHFLKNISIIIEKISGLIFNVDFFCGYSPERINPGTSYQSITSIIIITTFRSVFKKIHTQDCWLVRQALFFVRVAAPYSGFGVAQRRYHRSRIQGQKQKHTVFMSYRRQQHRQTL